MTNDTTSQKGKKSRVVPRALGALADLVDAVDRGKPLDRRFVVRTISVSIPSRYSPREIRAVRRRLKVSQSVFAAMLGVSVQLVQAWEQGVRRPQPWARRLLDSVDRDQSVLRLTGA